jgi:hypothetical protein
MELVKLFTMVFYITHFVGCGFYLIADLERDPNGWIFLGNLAHDSDRW